MQSVFGDVSVSGQELSDAAARDDVTADVELGLPLPAKEVRRCIKGGESKRIHVKKSAGNRMLGHAQSVLLTFAALLGRSGPWS